MTWIELRKPLPIPYKPIHVAWSDGDTFEFQPRNAKRMCLPADYANNKLYAWNQDFQGLTLVGLNPWRGRQWYSGGMSDYFHILHLGIRAGTARLWTGQYNYSSTSMLPFHWLAWYCNYVKDTSVHKFSFEFYLDNDLEETNPTMIYDDDETVWTPTAWGTGTIGVPTISEELTEVKKGASSLKIVVGSGTYGKWGVYRAYDPPQDFSAYDFICLWFYGANTGGTITTYLWDGTNLSMWNIIDNFTGWKRFVFPLRDPDQIPTGTQVDLTSIRRVYVSTSYGTASLAGTWYLDRTVVDVGQWVKVEAYVPDVLLNSGSGIKIYSWDGSAWASPYWFAWNPYKAVGYSSYSGAGYLLDGSLVYNIYDAFHWTGFIVGERGETKGYIHSSAAGKITYSSYHGCKKRIGFAIKMPPDDGQDSSTYGISQCKLKLEVYYDKETYAGVDRYGAATYEFENSTSSYYGLQNINEAWIALFPASGPSKGAEMLFLSAKPTGLEVSADEDEVIYKVKLTLPKGTAVYAGSLLHGDVTLDSDGDGVPDCLEMLSYQLTGQ